MKTARLFQSGGPFFLVAGPCALEGDDVNLRVAEALARLSDKHNLPVVFKGSCDKANRTSVDSPRGPGILEGLKQLERVSKASGLPVLTDVHEQWQAVPVAEFADVLQVPAFLSRQTDLLCACGDSGLPVNVKKGQWMEPGQIAHSVEKVRGAGGELAAVTERGTAFGYGRWVVDMRSFSIMREAAGCPALFDATHSVQLPGAQGSSSGGEREHVPALAKAAVAAGADGVYMEVHPDPSEAVSDSATQWPLDRLGELVWNLLDVREAA